MRTDTLIFHGYHDLFTYLLNDWSHFVSITKDGDVFTVSYGDHSLSCKAHRHYKRKVEVLEFLWCRTQNYFVWWQTLDRPPSKELAEIRDEAEYIASVCRKMFGEWWGDQAFLEKNGYTQKYEYDPKDDVILEAVLI